MQKQYLPFSHIEKEVTSFLSGTGYKDIQLKNIILEKENF
jgi:hypothetical protein